MFFLQQTADLASNTQTTANTKVKRTLEPLTNQQTIATLINVNTLEVIGNESIIAAIVNDISVMLFADAMLNFESGKSREELKTVEVEQVSTQHLRITGDLVSLAPYFTDMKIFVHNTEILNQNTHQNNNGNQVDDGIQIGGNGNERKKIKK